MPSIEDWLNGLGLGKYSKVFAENDVDLRALPHLNDADLQELGVSLGHRKVMLAAITELRHAEKRKPSSRRSLSGRGRSSIGNQNPAGSSRRARPVPTSGCSASSSATWSNPRAYRH